MAIDRNNLRIVRNYQVAGYLANSKGELFIKSLCDLFNEIALEHTYLLDLDIETLRRQGLTWMAHRFRIIIDQMPSHGDEVELATMPTGVDRLFTMRCFRMKNKGKDAVKAFSEWLMVDIERRRPVRPTPRVQEVCTILSVPEDIPHGEIQAKDLPVEMQLTRTFTATFDNIDFNGHVTQSSYMMWLSNSLSFDFHSTHKMIEAELVYESEILAEQEINSYIQISVNGSETVVWHMLTSPADGKRHCFGRTKWISI